MSCHTYWDVKLVLSSDTSNSKSESLELSMWLLIGICFHMGPGTCPFHLHSLWMWRWYIYMYVLQLCVWLCIVTGKPVLQGVEIVWGVLSGGVEDKGCIYDSGGRWWFAASPRCWGLGVVVKLHCIRWWKHFSYFLFQLPLQFHSLFLLHCRLYTRK